MSATSPDQRPLLAYVVNTLTPYRVHNQLRIAAEVPEFRLATIVTWDTKRHLWHYDNMPQIGMVSFDNAVAESEHGTLAYYRKDWATGGRIVQWLEREQPRAVVICGYGFPSHYRVIRWCASRGIPYFIWADSNIHGDTATGIKRRVKNAIVSPLVRGAAAILPCGTSGVRFFSRYGATPDRTFLAPVEPDYRLIEHPEPALLAEVATRFGLRADRRRMLIVARLVPLKSTDIAIDAFAALADQRPQWDLVIVGDGPLRRELEGRVPPRLRERVIFTGFIDQAPVVAAIERQCDLLLHPGYWEAWGVVLLEAAAAGLAIIASNVVGAAADLVREDVNGRLHPPRDVAALFEAMRQVTQEGVIDGMKRASLMVSEEFRMRADPITGIRAALRSAKLLPPV
jgi:glycosyltransferase involved in cell wall biosynthesis